MTGDAGDSRVGTQIGPYLLKRLLGRGGMGEVYVAEDTVRERTVALKLMSPAFAQDPVFRKRLQREARSAGKLSEPHVVPIHDYGEVDGHLFVDMRLIEGVDLATLLGRNGPLTPARAVAIVRQIASALDAAHGEGVMHRDVKPANILIANDDFACLVDFGIANAATEEKLTRQGDVLGTFAYMSPERLTGDEAKITHRADIYALACVLYETLTGVQPYRGNPATVMTSHIVEPIPQASATNPTIPRSLDEVITKGMAKEPNERYLTAGDLAVAAHRALTATDQNEAAAIINRTQIAVLRDPAVSGPRLPVAGRTPTPTPGPPAGWTPTPAPPAGWTPTPPPVAGWTPTPTPGPPAGWTPTPTPVPTQAPTPPPHGWGHHQPPTTVPPPNPYAPNVSQGAGPPSIPPTGQPHTVTPAAFPAAGAAWQGPVDQSHPSQPAWPQSTPPQPTGGRSKTPLLLGAVGAILLVVVVVAAIVFWPEPKPVVPVDGGDQPNASGIPIKVLDDGVEVGNPDAPVTIDVYDEPICPPCGDFISSSADDLAAAVTDEKIAVRYHLLNFLNRESGSRTYSSRAVAASLCVADANDGKLYMDFYHAIFESDFQPKEQALTDRSDGELADLAEKLGAPASVRTCIEDDERRDDADKAAELAYSELGDLTSGGTPAAFDGRKQLDIEDPNWVDDLG